MALFGIFLQFLVSSEKPNAWRAHLAMGTYALLEKELSSIYLVDKKWPKCFLLYLPLSFCSVASPLGTVHNELNAATLTHKQILARY